MNETSSPTSTTTSSMLSTITSTNINSTTTSSNSTEFIDGIECGIPSICTECTSLEPQPCNITVCPFASYCCNDNTECCVDIPDPIPQSNLPIILGVSIPVSFILLLTLTTLILLYLFNKKFKKIVKSLFGIKKADKEPEKEFDDPNYEYANSSSTYYNSPEGSENYMGYDILKGAKKHVYKESENQYSDISKQKKNF